MNINYKEEYVKSILSYISYMDLNIDNNESQYFINKNLIEFQNAQDFRNVFLRYITENGKEPKLISLYNDLLYPINLFINNFKILDQIVTTGYNGFSAITYRLENDIIDTNLKEGQIFVCFRGTESSQIGDLLSDFKLTFSSNLGWPTSQEAQAISFLEDWIATDDIYVCGHSLGGYLAARSFYHLDKEQIKRIKGVSTFNGAGFSTIIGNPLLHTNKLYGDKVKNFFSYRGLELTSGDINEFLSFDGNISLFQHLGKRIKTVAENPGGFTGNHSMALLVKSMGFYSIFQNLLKNIPNLTDLENSILKNEQQKIYAMERIMMGSVPEDNDFGLLYNTVAKNLIRSFGFQVDSQAYTSEVSQLLSLQETLLRNTELSIKLIDGISFSASGKDNNEKRSIMNALLNDLPYVTIVPENYSFGIFNKSNPNNEKYNMEHYTGEYLTYRCLYNNALSAIMENKLINGYAISLNKNDIKIQDVFTPIQHIQGEADAIIEKDITKFAFVIQKNSKTNSNDLDNAVFVNTTKSEYENGDVQIVYFTNEKDLFRVTKPNALVFDSIDDNVITIEGNTSIIHSMSGYDIFNFGRDCQGNIFIADDIKPKNKIDKTVNNNNSRSGSLTVKYNQYKLKDIFVIASPFANSPLMFVTENITINVNGSVDIEATDLSLESDIIRSIIDNFSENFLSVSGSNFILDEAFIDRYCDNTRNSFRSININSKNITDNTKFSQEHHDYIVNKINKFYGIPTVNQKTRMLKTLAVEETNADRLKAYLQSKITEPQIDTASLISQIQEDALQLNNIKDISIRELFNQKINDFNVNNYSDTQEFKIDENLTNNILDNIYYKKETPIMNKIYDKDTHEWTGETEFSGRYAYNRQENGVQLSFIYSDILEQGEVIEYYKQNILVDVLQYDQNPIGEGGDNYGFYSNAEITGSNGSDILLTKGKIIGQPLGQSNNGNNVLIGSEATVESGNNYIKAGTVKAGSGSNLTIGGSVFFDHEYKGTLSKNYAYNAYVVYSGLGETITVNSDLVLGNGNNTSINDKVFIGGFSALSLVKEKMPSMITSEIESYYNEYPTNSNINYVYNEAGTVFLASNDFGNIISGTLYGLGNNEIVAEKSTIYSGGNSNLKVLDNCIIYLGNNDTYISENSSDSKFISNPSISEYNIKGRNNSLQLGVDSYSVTFDGVYSNIIMEENAQELTVQFNGVGENRLNLKNLNSLNINTVGSLIIQSDDISDLNITTQSDIDLKFNSISNLEINNQGSNKYTINKAVKDSNITSNITINGTNGFVDLSLSNLTLTSLELTNDDYNLSISESNVKTFKLDSPKTFNIFANDSEFEDISINTISTDIKVSNVNGFRANNTDENTITLDKASSLSINTTDSSKYYLELGEIDDIELLKGNYQLIMNAKPTSLTVNVDDTKLSIIQVNNSEITADTVKTIATSPVKFSKISSAYLLNDVTLFGLSELKINEKTFNVNDLDSILSNSPAKSNAVILSEDGFVYSYPEDNTVIITPTEPDVPEIPETIERIIGADSDDIFTLNNNVKYIITSSNGDDNYNFTSQNLFNNTFNYNGTTGLSTISSIYNISLDVVFRDVAEENLTFEIIFNNVTNANDLSVYINQTKVLTLQNYSIFTLSIKIINEENTVTYSGVDIRNKLFNIYGSVDSDIINGHETGYSEIYPKQGDETINILGGRNNIYYKLGDGIKTINANNNVTYSLIMDVSINSSLLSYSKNGISGLNILYQGNLICTINNPVFLSVEKSEPYYYESGYDLLNNLEKIIGTDGDDTLTGNSDGNSNFYAGKGSDIINIVGGTNIINYSIGDGYKVIVNPNNIQVGILIDGVIDRSLLTYVQTDSVTLHVSYNNDLLFTWKNAAYCYLQFLGTTDFVYGSSLLNNNPVGPTDPTDPTNPTNPPSNVYSGTAGNDYQALSENVAYTINSSAGNDIYEFTIGNGNNNVLNYSIGSGLTTIKTSGNNFVFLNIKFSNIDKSLLKFDIVKNQFGSESELTILYNNVAIIKINNYINVSLLINITNNGESITMNNSDIEASLYSINGTDGDDNLIGNTTNSIFNPGKGIDLINIVGGSNRINYKAGDGCKTVINPTFSYVVVAFDSSIDKTLITYELGDNNSLNVKYNGELIFTLKQPNASGLQFSDYSIVNGYEILQGLSTINGTDADEIINGNSSGPSIINPKKGTDIINLVGGQNTINYTVGDGYKTINSTGLYYQININGTVDNLLLSYVKNGDEAVDVKYNDELIFSISDPYNATIALTNYNQYIYLSQVYDELNAIQGTDGDDILYGTENGSYLIGKKGNDEINLVGGYNTIGYAIGDGHDTIKGEYSHMIRLSGVVDRELLTFDQVGTQMNVSYDGEVILTVEYPYMSNIQIEETYEFIYLSDYMTDE